jgi:hypothetical protein
VRRPFISPLPCRRTVSLHSAPSRILRITSAPPRDYEILSQPDESLPSPLHEFSYGEGQHEVSISSRKMATLEVDIDFSLLICDSKLNTLSYRFGATTPRFAIHTISADTKKSDCANTPFDEITVFVSLLSSKPTLGPCLDHSLLISFAPTHRSEK